MSIQQRKKDHVELTVSGDVQYRQPTGLDRYGFIHNALPEVNFNEVSTEATLLGRTFSFPLFISSMTGGYTEAGAVNARIAEFCEANDLPFGVGSQRIMLEDSDAVSTFSVVREKAPTAFIAANIGGAQLVEGLSGDQVDLLIGSIKADAVIVHLNPLQELMQPEGDRNFKGVEDGIRQLVSASSVPIVVKETGAGISGEVAKRLLKLGVSVIDISGAGGTSWARVENRRKDLSESDNLFDDWGIPTHDCLNQCAALKHEHNFDLIASGGIRNSMDIAKALCLGADFAAMAQPVIRAVVNDGIEGLQVLFYEWQRQLKTILTLLGCEQVKDLGPEHIRLADSQP